MQPLNNKKKKMDQNKSKEIMLCMMIKAIRNTYKANKNKEKWFEEQQKLFFQKKI